VLAWQIAFDAGVYLFDALLDFSGHVVAIAVADCLEFAAVDGSHGLLEQAGSAAKHHELAAHHYDRWSIVTAEIGNRLEVWRHAPGQRHQLDIALRLALEPAAGWDAVQVAVDIQLQQDRRRVAGALRVRRDRRFKAERSEIQFFDERLDYANRVVLANVVVQALGE
jgi:hypothetical protein